MIIATGLGWVFITDQKLPTLEMFLEYLDLNNFTFSDFQPPIQYSRSEAISLKKYEKVDHMKRIKEMY